MNQSIAAMQSINITVITPLFLAVFMGTGILCAVLIVMSLINWHGTPSIIMIGGSLLYILGCLAVTTILNVPLNNELAAANAADPKSVELWARYLSDWTFWNSVRTAASLASSAALTVGLVWVK